MSESLVNDWAELIEDWNGDRPDVRADMIRVRVDRERRRMVRTVVAEIILTIVVVVAAAYALFRFPSDWTRLFTLNLGMMLVAMWGFAVWNRRGLWRPLGETTEAFVRLARLRCRRKLQALGFATAVVGAQLLFVAAWRVWGPRDAPFTRSDALAALPVLAAVVFVVGLIVARRRVAAEMAELDGLGL